MTDRPPPLQTVDLLPDQLSLARAQLGSGLHGLAEGVLLRLIAGLEAAGRGGLEELDAARSLLAECLWRQGRPLAAGAVVAGIRATSLERRRPLVMLIEAEALAAAGDSDRAARLAERVVSAIGVDEAWKLRGGVATRITWPAPSSFRAPARRPDGVAGPPARARLADPRADSRRPCARWRQRAMRSPKATWTRVTASWRRRSGSTRGSARMERRSWSRPSRGRRPPSVCYSTATSCAPRAARRTRPIAFDRAARA